MVVPEEFAGSPEMIVEPRREEKKIGGAEDHGEQAPLPVFLFHIPDPTPEPGKKKGGGWRGSWLQPQDTPRKLVCLCACQRVNLPLGPCLSQASPLFSSLPVAHLPHPLPWASGCSPEALARALPSSLRYTVFYALPPVLS